MYQHRSVRLHKDIISDNALARGLLSSCCRVVHVIVFVVLVVFALYLFIYLFIYYLCFCLLFV